MKRIISLIIASALLILSLPAYAIDNTYSETVNNTVSGYVSNISGDIEVVSQSKTPSIYVDENDYVGVLHAVDNLKSDIKTVTDVEVTGASDFQSADIVIGTIGKSATIDELIANDEIDVSKIENQWEAFTIQNVNGKLLIVGANVADGYVKVTLVNSSDSENANVTLFTATAHKRRKRAETKILKQF